MSVCVVYSWDAACLLGIRVKHSGPWDKRYIDKARQGSEGRDDTPPQTPGDLQSPQQLQVSADGLARSFLSSFIGSGNSLYNSTSVS